MAWIISAVYRFDPEPHSSKVTYTERTPASAGIHLRRNGSRLVLAVREVDGHNNQELLDAFSVRSLYSMVSQPASSRTRSKVRV